MGSSGLPRGGGISAGNNSSKSSRPVAFPMRHGPVAFPMRHGPPNLPRCGLPPASHVVVSSSAGNGGNAAPTPRAEAAKASSYPSTSSTPEAAHPLLSYETYEQGCDDDGEQQVCEDDGEQRRPSRITHGVDERYRLDGGGLDDGGVHASPYQHHFEAPGAQPGDPREVPYHHR